MSMKMQVQLNQLQARVDQLEKLVTGEVPIVHAEHPETGNEHVGALRLKHKGWGFWDVVNQNGAVLNGGRMKKQEAEDFIASHAA